MPPTRKNRGGSSPRRQTRRTTNPDKIAAKEYVKTIKDLRVELKAIQQQYRDAEAIVKNPQNEKANIKAINDMRNASLDKDEIVFPLPIKQGESEMSLNIIKKIKIKERWNIIATAKLWKRDLSLKRKPLGEAVDKLNAALEPVEFKAQLKFLTRPRPDSRINENNLSGPYGNPAPPAYENPGPSYKSEKSSKYGFPTSTPPPEYPPPNYTVGGSRHKRKNKNKTRKNKSHKKRYTRK